ncbi:general transcription factor 3C polypeptide 3 [Coccinella septempunctata]|uniref:general transcription factor 3C polypeptide 3 n=1 Tax=Coccinella septempunctata TaxID=41139 RepID=UPI001D063B17|nr:general transcription factor 3C polypeptide 3 [Coccinella septempunctata]
MEESLTESSDKINSENYDSDEFFEDDYEIDDDYEQSTSSQDKKEEKKECVGRNSSKLTPQLKGLMGEANLRFAKGEIETAEQMCLEVIRQQPKAWEPYLTLSQIYESKDSSKCKGYLTIATYLNPSNTSTWCRLAEMALEEGNKREAIGFYSKSLVYDKKNLEVHYKRLELAKELGSQRLIIRFQEFLLAHIPEDRHEEIIERASNITKIYHNQKKYLKALNVLRIPFKRVPQYVTLHHLNMMLELLLLTDKYAECLDIFVDFCNFNFEIVVEQDESITINDYTMPNDISIDLKTKFVVCAIKLNCFDVANKIIDKIVEEEDVEIVGDLYLDICEALIAKNKYDVALKLFIPLKKSKNYSLAAVWLKYSECLAACGMKEQAIEGYYNVITLAPQHIEVLHPLAELLLEMKKEEEALQVMSYQATDRLNVGVLISRMKLLKQIGHLEEFWNCLELLLSRHCIVFRHISEIKHVLTPGKTIDKVQRVQKIREFISDTAKVIPNADTNCVMEPEVEEEISLLKESIQFAMDNRDYANMEKFVMMALSSKKFEKYYEDLAHMGILACLYNGDHYHGYYLARDFVIKYPNNNYFWNLFNLFTAQSDSRMHKFIYRFQQKPLANEACDILEANADFFFGNYHSALKYFMREFRLTKSPYISFILGIILLHLGTIKKNTPQEVKMQLTETTTYLFLFYKAYRSKMAEQEIFFNLGRMYSQLGITYLAVEYFKKVLEVENELLEQNPDILCLRYEAAYNLHLIYQKTNKNQARNILIKYLTI